MLAVAVDLADDRFDVRHDPARIGAAAIVEAVRDLGYEPEVVSEAIRAEQPPGAVDPASLPAEWAELFARSRASGAPILVDFFAPD